MCVCSSCLAKHSTLNPWNQPPRVGSTRQTSCRRCVPHSQQLEVLTSLGGAQYIWTTPLRGEVGIDLYGLSDLAPQEQDQIGIGASVALRATRVANLCRSRGISFATEKPLPRPGHLFMNDPGRTRTSYQGSSCLHRCVAAFRGAGVVGGVAHFLADLLSFGFPRDQHAGAAIVELGAEAAAAPGRRRLLDGAFRTIWCLCLVRSLLQRRLIRDLRMRC